MNREKADLKDRMDTRERLKIEKPLVLEKFINLDKKLEKGEKNPPVIELAYNYACNLTCDHCFATSFTKKDRKLTIKDVENLSIQADEMGVYQIILQGGEPILWKDLDDVVMAINPKKFYLGLVSNASLLDDKKVKHLREIGIDKLVISLDAYDQEEYEKNRKKDGLFHHTLDMIAKAREVGLRVVVNTVATKNNVRSKNLLKLIELAKEQGFIVYVNFATPIGSWEGRYDLLLTEEDAEYIYQLNREHEILKRDLYPFKGINIGCSALRNIVYITQYGDVLPCPFIHISVGNIFENKLSNIIEEGLKLKCFEKNPKVCLASEDLDFIKNKIAKTYNKKKPVYMKEIFSENEFNK